MGSPQFLCNRGPRLEPVVWVLKPKLMRHPCKLLFRLVWPALLLGAAALGAAASGGTERHGEALAVPFCPPSLHALACRWDANCDCERIAAP